MKIGIFSKAPWQGYIKLSSDSIRKRDYYYKKKKKRLNSGFAPAVSNLFSGYPDSDYFSFCHAKYKIIRAVCVL